MSKLDLTNKVSPCCGKRIEEYTIDSLYQGEITYYKCSYCGGEFTKTEILRANVESEEKIKFPFKSMEDYYKSGCSKCKELEKENVKLKVALKILLEQY